MPSNYATPGVYIQETLSSLNTPAGPSANSIACFTAPTNRGPLVPTLISSWSRYTRLYGGFTNGGYLPLAVFSFFSNGGSSVYINRVATSTAVAATRVLNDTQTTPAATLTVNAANPGAWGNSIYIDINAGYTPGRFDLLVHYGDDTQGSIVETWSDLTMQPADSRYAPAIINAGSAFIQVVDDSDPGVFPANAPAAQQGTALATGADGGVPAASDITNALNLLSNIASPLVLNMPGVTDTTDVNNALTFCQGNGNIFLVVDPPANQTVTQMTTLASTYTVTSYGAVYYPWLVVNDPTKSTPSLTTTVPPGGSVLGQYAASDAAHGPYKTPAGVSTQLAGVVDTAAHLQASDLASLASNTVPVNVIRNIPSYGICIFGGRTLKAGYADRYISARRSLMYLEKSLTNLTAFAVFEPNDTSLWDNIYYQVDAFMNAYYQKGGLRGATAQDAYFVKCDADLNTLAAIQSGVVNLQVGVALEYPAEFVVINIGQYEGGSSTSSAL